MNAINTLAIPFCIPIKVLPFFQTTENIPFVPRLSVKTSFHITRVGVTVCILPYTLKDFVVVALCTFSRAELRT